MAYEFHYTPAGTGVISGKEVLEQTEDAINDLGNTAISGVQEALDKAEQALTNSANAVDDAQTALNTANNAEGVAIQAQTDVGNLSGTVTNIGNRVTTAEGNISNLQGRMTTAEGNITNLQGRMTTAETNIGNLQTAVSTAQATANSAQQTANTARQQSYVLRYSSSSITDNSTVAYSTLDNTDNIKSGDKVIDVDGKIFAVVSVDTANQTVTVGSALIDLALDANVVHTNRNDDVSIPLNSTSAKLGVTGGSTDITFLDKNNKKLSGLTLGNYGSSKLSYARLNIFDKDVNDNEIQDTLEYSYVSNNNNAYLRVGRDNFCTLGSTSYRWKGVYAQSYYYGSNNVEFSNKFVTTDTNQTVGGTKTFSNDIVLQGSTTPVIKTISNIVQDTSAYNGSVSWVIRDKDDLNNILESALYKYSAKSIDWQLKLTGIDNGVSNTKGLRFTLDPVNGVANFIPIGNNSTSLGNSNTKWKAVYATNYYYGIDNVEFSTKFVTTDTNQDVSGQKVFTDINAISNTAEIGSTSGNNSFKVLDKNKKTISRLEGGTFSTGMAYSYLLVNNGSDVFNGVSLYQSSANSAQLRPYSSTLSLQLGASNRSFFDCYTSKVNGLTPSSLSLPSQTYVDISGYFTNTGTGEFNTYTAPSNGWIFLRLGSISSCQAQVLDSSDNTIWGTSSSGSVEMITIPILSGCKLQTQWATGSTVNVANARFYPCQGNV